MQELSSVQLGEQEVVQRDSKWEGERLVDAAVKPVCSEKAGQTCQEETRKEMVSGAMWLGSPKKGRLQGPWEKTKPVRLS